MTQAKKPDTRDRKAVWLTPEQAKELDAACKRKQMTRAAFVMAAVESERRKRR